MDEQATPATPPATPGLTIQIEESTDITAWGDVPPTSFLDSFTPVGNGRWVRESSPGHWVWLLSTEPMPLEGEGAP